MNVPNIQFTVESLAKSNSGIARLARLSAKVLGEMLQNGRLSASCLSLSDKSPATDIGLPVSTACGSRWTFVWKNQAASLTATHFMYDFLGMSRAHCLIPFFNRPFLSWICGIEVWEGAASNRFRWAKRADTLVSISEYTKKRAIGLQDDFVRAKVCWLATETDEPVVRKKNNSHPPTVTIISRIDADGGYKGHRELIEAWPQVVSTVPDARLVIVGRGPGFDQMQVTVQASSVASAIEMRGFVPEEQIEKVWHETSVFAMPSRGEGFGLVYIEAMRQGIPVIASVHDAGQEINLDGETGYNVNLDHPEELPERIIHLLKNQDVAVKFGQAGQRRWAEHFRYDCFRQRFTPLLEEFLSI